MKKAWHFLKNHQRLLSIIFLFLWLFSTWYLFFHLKIVEGLALQVAASISYLGFGFALFQFWFNHITTEKRRLYDLRYNAYKEIVRAVDVLSETLNEELTETRLLEVNSLVCKLMNQCVAITALLKSVYFLFPNISDTKENIKLHEILQNTMTRTFKYRKAVESAIKMGNVDKNNFLDTVPSTNFHDDMLKNVGELNFQKYLFYAKLQEYFK